MFTESIDKLTASHKATRRHHFLSLLIAFVFGLMIYPTEANAQIVGDIEVNIPFQFHAGNARLPAGKYRIHVLDDSNQAVMEIISADGSTSALFPSPKNKMNLHPTKKRVKQSAGSLFKKDCDQFSAVKRSLRNRYVDWKVTCISLTLHYSEEL